MQALLVFFSTQKSNNKPQASQHCKKNPSNGIGFVIPGRAFQKIWFPESFLQAKKLEIGFALGEPLTFQVQNCTKSYLWQGDVLALKGGTLQIWYRRKI